MEPSPIVAVIRLSQQIEGGVSSVMSWPFATKEEVPLFSGMHDQHPHRVVGTSLGIDALGELESKIYNDTGIRPKIYDLYEDEDARSGRVVVIDTPRTSSRESVQV